MNQSRRLFAASLLVMTFFPLGIPGFAAPPKPSRKAEIETARQGIRSETIAAHLRFLSDDLLEGRGPGTRGAELAAKYVAAQFEAFGLEPGANAGWYQNVPIVNSKADPKTAMSVTGANGQTETFKYGEEFTAQTGLSEPLVEINGTEIVFVGYGITAPEFNWDDYKGVDVKNKIVLMKVNDPPSEDPKFFGGKAMTYYGRWTYKYEEAARRGAKGVLLIHTTETAAYPWQVVQSSNTGWRSELVREPSSPPVVELKSWLEYGAAFRLAKLGGFDLPKLEETARGRDFKPVPLGVKLNVTLRSETKRLDSPNVAGLVRGSDPKLKNEYVVFTAHYDHIGIRENNPGDKIYNGAKDNASGVAAMLGVAEAVARMKTPPKRSILFLAVTAEEQGLLGSQYYAEHPVYPLLATAANINLDVVNVLGETRDFTAMGADRSSLGTVIDRLAKENKLVIKPEQFPEKGSFFRSDHFCFAKVGVPCASISGGVDVVGKPAGWGKEKSEEYTAKDYHQPSDEIKPDWDFRGTRQHAQFAFLISVTVADDPVMPEWKAGEPFKNPRDEMRKKSEL